MNFLHVRSGSTLIIPLILITTAGIVLSSTSDEKLVHHLFSNYNKHIRPARKIGDVTNVTFYLTILQLISVTEKSEEMTTSQYVTLQWEDPRLTWKPSEHKGVTQLRLPSRLFWKPDIVLHNNNDGRYDTTVPVNALLNHTGMIEWLPAAIYKSACQIKVDLFPFDWQNCTMKFRSFTYDKNELFITSTYDKVVFDKQAYRDNGEWTIIHCPIRTNEDPNDPTYQDISLNFIIQRKPLFYVINIIVPCVLISSLSVLVFYLPSGSSEKMTMSISVLLGLTVYLLLLAKRVPETSLGVPLIGAYLLFTMLTVTLSIIFSVIVLNIYHRTPSTSAMPLWVQQIFMVKLPAILRMDRPFSTRQMLLDETERNNYVSRSRSLKQQVSRGSNSSVTSPRDCETTKTGLGTSTSSGQFRGSITRQNCNKIQTVCSGLEQHEIASHNRDREITHRRRRMSRHLIQQMSVDSVCSGASSGSTSERRARLSSRRNEVTKPRRNPKRLVAQSSEPTIRTEIGSCSLQQTKLIRTKLHNSVSGPRSTVGCNHSLPHRRALQRSKPVNREHTDLPEADQELCGTRDDGPRRFGERRDKAMFLYKTTDRHTWRHSPSRSDMKGQTRVRRSCRPFNHVISPLHRKQRSHSVLSQPTSSNAPTTPPSGTSASLECNAKSQREGFQHRFDLNSVSSSSSDTDSEIAPIIEAAYKAPAPCITTEGKVPEGMLVAANAVDYIANNMKTTDRMKVMIEDWHFVAAVADRLLLWIFSLVFAAGTLHFCLKAILNSPPDHPFYGGDPKWANCWLTTSDSRYSPWSG